jgi:hypothetical protein
MAVSYEIEILFDIYSSHNLLRKIIALTELMRSILAEKKTMSNALKRFSYTL